MTESTVSTSRHISNTESGRSANNEFLPNADAISVLREHLINLAVYTPQAMHPVSQPMPGYQQSQYYQYPYNCNRPTFYPQCHQTNTYQRPHMINNEPYDLNRQSPDLPVPARYEMNVDVIARKHHVPMAAWAKPTPLNMDNLIDSSKLEHVSPAARDKLLAERILFEEKKAEQLNRDDQIKFIKLHYDTTYGYQIKPDTVV
ncbi:unnamed protein product [Mytilus edulis]|uniref:Uncharacterized protein n=1 Tax=Mytilus edulis TaxID=6550 RepID=A0A8S3QWU1_MYTED|nr:unnamed protein product [Mytilus edulis]